MKAIYNLGALCCLIIAIILYCAALPIDLAKAAIKAMNEHLDRTVNTLRYKVEVLDKR